jgi:hypothetical protein
LYCTRSIEIVGFKRLKQNEVKKTAKMGKYPM